MNLIPKGQIIKQGFDQGLTIIKRAIDGNRMDVVLCLRRSSGAAVPRIPGHGDRG